MRIGELADQTHVKIQTLRYYERRGLLAPPERLASGYRVYDSGSVQRVRFIRRAQELGFTLNEIIDLLTLWDDVPGSCAAVQQRATAALDRIEAKIQDLKKMRRGLGHYVEACRRRDPVGSCPLLRELGGSETDNTDH